MKPVQKLPQLKMLLERLLKKTPKDHPDRWFAIENYRKSYEFGPGQNNESAYRFWRGFWWESTRHRGPTKHVGSTRHYQSRRMRGKEKGGSF